MINLCILFRDYLTLIYTFIFHIYTLSYSKTLSIVSKYERVLFFGCEKYTRCIKVVQMQHNCGGYINCIIFDCRITYPAIVIFSRVNIMKDQSHRWIAERRRFEEHQPSTEQYYVSDSALIHYPLLIRYYSLIRIIIMRHFASYVI